MSRGGYAMNEMLLELGQNAKEAENMLRTITTNKKNQVRNILWNVQMS
mgnify:CR=1 FL=1